MRADSILQKFEIYLIAALAVVLVSGVAFALSDAFTPQDYGIATTSKPSSNVISAPAQESPPLLEPALRNLDGVTQHG